MKNRVSLSATGMRLFVGVVRAALLLSAVGCSQQGTEEQPMPEKAIQEVLQEHTDSLMSLPGVVGTGEGECSGEPCIKVFVVRKTAELLEQIPTTIGGYTVEVQVIREIKALDAD